MLSCAISTLWANSLIQINAPHTKIHKLFLAQNIKLAEADQTCKDICEKHCKELEYVIEALKQEQYRIKEKESELEILKIENGTHTIEEIQRIKDDMEASIARMKACHAAEIEKMTQTHSQEMQVSFFSV